MTDTWQPIKTAPKDGTGFLGFVRADWIEGFMYSDGCICWLSDGDGPSRAEDFPTHWMHRPAPPTKETEC